MKKDNKIDAYFRRYGVAPKQMRTLECFSRIMLRAATFSAKTDLEFLTFFVSSKREINSFIKSGKLPKRVENLIS